MSLKRRKRAQEDRRGVRKGTCGDCWRNCRRAENSVCHATYEEIKFSLEQAVETGERTGKRAFITPNTVLGRMYELKEKDWTRFVNGCPHHGEWLPTTTEDLLEWAVGLRPLKVRVALGVDKESALRMKSALKVRELRDYYELMVEKMPVKEEPVEEDDGDQDLPC